MTKFKVGDRVKCIRSPGFSLGPEVDRVYTVSHIDSRWLGLAELGGKETGWEIYHFVPADKEPPKTAEEKAIARKEAELAALKEAAAKKAQRAAELKAKRERQKLMRALSPAGRRVAELLKAKSDAFGCQRDHVIALAAAITGDDADKIRKALA